MVHEIVDILIRPARCDGNRANHAIARLAFVSGSRATAIIELKMFAHASSSFRDGRDSSSMNSNAKNCAATFKKARMKLACR